MFFNVSPEAVILGLGGGFAGGFGLLTAARLLRELKDFRRSELATEAVENDSGKRQETSFFKSGKKRDSSVLALAGNAVRHTDGSYTAGFTAETVPTLLVADERVDGLFDGLSRLLVSEKPAGTILQFRWANHFDNGAMLLESAKTSAPDEIYHPARVLQEDSLRHTAFRLGAEGFRSARLSVWCKVPVKHERDSLNNGATAFLRTFQEAFRPDNITAAWKKAKSAAGDGIIRRMLEDERQARNDAEMVFRLVEREFPLKLKRFDRGSLWQALYLNHNERARHIPALPDETAGFFDLRWLLCQDTIQPGSGYLLHGDTPVAVVSLSLPPAPQTENGIMRLLTQNPMLRFRYTLVVEYVNYGKKKALKKIDWALFWNKRSRNLYKSPEAERAASELERLRYDLAGPNAALIGTRVYALVYGTPVKNKAELEISIAELDENCDRLVSTFKQLPGAEAVREDTAALRILYQNTLLGEMSDKPTGFEVDEQAQAAASFAPLEGAWRGLERPHTVLENASGELFGINLFQSKDNTSALGIVLGQTRSGKSVLIGKFIADILGSRAGASVVAMDFGETYRPLVEVLGGRQIRFVPDESEIKTLNIWDYRELETGEMPSEAQIALVVGDLLNLAGISEGTEEAALKSAICESVVREVYCNIVPLNNQGAEKREPLHSDFLNALENFPFEGVEKDEADKLRVLLQRYRGHAWLDAPTHAEFTSESKFDVYELDSLEKFSDIVRHSLAYRVAAKIITSAGRKSADGRFLPKVQIFDEMHKVKDQYPQILKAILRGARQGGKENLVTLLATHAYEDLADLHGLTKNAGIKIIGKQIGDFSLLAKHAEFSDAGAEAVRNIQNVIGGYSQFVFCFGSGPDQKTEVGQVVLSPCELWTHTSNPHERNARSKVAALMFDQPLLGAVAFLAEKYPRGLAAVGLEDIEPEIENELLQRRAAMEQFWREQMAEEATESNFDPNSLPNEEIKLPPDVEWQELWSEMKNVSRRLRELHFDFTGKVAGDEVRGLADELQEMENLSRILTGENVGAPVAK